ncbi:membrane integrity-associated transporter subunit PqiC [Serratia plymuthica]|uniref:PqiC family protein n=1 Tax=Serratia plymuthica TaxID=82996 RepID=UPI003DA2EF1F
MMSPSRLCFLMLMVSLTACSSPSVHYHTLVAPAADPPPVQPAPFLIAVLPVGIPPQIDLPQLVVRQGQSGALVLENERWLSPLGDEIRTALSAELVQRLGTQDIAGLAKAGETPTVRIQLEIRRFDAWPGRAVELDAGWSLNVQGRRLVCRSRLTQAVQPGYTAMLQGQQQVIGNLAGRIAATARHWAMDDRGRCTP